MLEQHFPAKLCQELGKQTRAALHPGLGTAAGEQRWAQHLRQNHPDPGSRESAIPRIQATSST